MSPQSFGMEDMIGGGLAIQPMIVSVSKEHNTGVVGLQSIV